MASHVNILFSAIGFVASLLITAFTPPEFIHRDVTPAPSLELLPASDAQFARAETEGALHGPALPVFTLRATAYNSLPEQTSGDPFTTATGERTRFGIIAVSRELLPKHIPYGSLVRIRDLGYFKDGRGHGKYQAMLDAQDYFIVEDTLHMRKREQIDVWFETLAEALEWGVRKVEVEVVRYGRDGPYWQAPYWQAGAAPIDVAPVLSASR